MASAKLANRTVNHNQSVIWKVKPAMGAPTARSRAQSTVVMTAPTSTTNITGFFSITRGCSLRNESPIARLTIGGSNNGRARSAFLGMSNVTSSVTGCLGSCSTATGISLPPHHGIQQKREELSALHQVVLHNRTQRQGWEVSQRANNQDHADQQHHK